MSADVLILAALPVAAVSINCAIAVAASTPPAAVPTETRGTAPRGEVTT
ncbi:hypothetical protein IU459_33730 [Nocardia amamiensis]|uniref:Uncharacterized protein n=1 Tax=Nocardia amamiensis TaxID=404578 RepID=A0ABS0D237_9NOCA|nr:hypothetical protein [Nocardia amamiensis]MBF6302465.1 hypothetical protein [Nocardia amamiensis]